MKIKLVLFFLLCCNFPTLAYSYNRTENSFRATSNKMASSNASPVRKNTYTPILKTFTVKGVSFDMIEVRGGKFTMGYYGDAQGSTYEKCKPAHEVTLSDFYIGKLEVTQELWEAVMGNNPSDKKNKIKPVNQVSYDDCLNFIKKLSEMTKVEFSLPTEAQWEFAALGGLKSHNYTYSGGNLDDVAIHSGNSSGIMRCGMMLPNELGIYDMSGNVFEFTSDKSHTWGASPTVDPKFDNPRMPYVIIKGGSYASKDWPCRVYYRSMARIDGYSPEIGFRIIMNTK